MSAQHAEWIDAPPVVWSDGSLLWHAVPGFVGAAQPVTIVRTTHPGFLESMRLFGVPAKHACRLEEHPGLGFADAGWRVALGSKSFLGVARFQIVNAGTGRCLGVGADGGTPAALAAPAASAPADTHVLWYLVPRPPYGYDLVHAGSGRRLDWSETGQRLQLVAAADGYTHWERVIFFRGSDPAATCCVGTRRTGRTGRTTGCHRFWRRRCATTRGRGTRTVRCRCNRWRPGDWRSGRRRARRRGPRRPGPTRSV